MTLTELTEQLKELTQRWRSGADGIRGRYRGMGPIAGSALATAETMETCAGAVEELLTSARPETGPGIGGPS